MKLQTHYNKINIIGTIIIFCFATIGYYFLLSYVLTDQLDETLIVEEAEIYDYIKKNNSLPEASIYDDQQIYFEKNNGPHFRIFKSAEVFHPLEKATEETRQLIFTVTVKGQQYIAHIIKTAEWTEGLVWIILFSTLSLLLLLTTAFFFINRLLMKKLWYPFHQTLSSIKQFNLSAPGIFTTPATSVTEFRELNESINLMAEKVTQDYQTLKSFTDNASHELQTPLAVIHSKLDILIQQPELQQESMELIQRIFTAVEKLSGLCKSLLLLTKIEQLHFSGKETVSIKKIVADKIADMQEWIRLSKLTIEQKGVDTIILSDKELVDILVSNLLRNAIQHTPEKGTIIIETGNDYLKISNTGLIHLDTNKIFNRFYKDGYSGGHGLGLSIIKQICDQYKFHCHYIFLEGHHHFTILFH